VCVLTVVVKMKHSDSVTIFIAYISALFVVVFVIFSVLNYLCVLLILYYS